MELRHSNTFFNAGKSYGVDAYDQNVMCTLSIGLLSVSSLECIQYFSTFVAVIV